MFALGVIIVAVAAVAAVAVAVVVVVVVLSQLTGTVHPGVPVSPGLNSLAGRRLFFFSEFLPLESFDPMESVWPTAGGESDILAEDTRYAGREVDDVRVDVGKLVEGYGSPGCAASNGRVCGLCLAVRGHYVFGLAACG